MKKSLAKLSEKIGYRSCPQVVASLCHIYVTVSSFLSIFATKRALEQVSARQAVYGLNSGLWHCILHMLQHLKITFKNGI